MRTTLDIDDDLLVAVRELAARNKVSAGRMTSKLLRAALTQPAVAPATKRVAANKRQGIFRSFASRGSLVSNETIDQLRDVQGV